MQGGSFKGKEIKDYLFGDSLAVFGAGSEVAKAKKSGTLNLTVYGIANSLIDASTFPIYNNEIAENTSQIYPSYYEIVRSQNYLYMIFEELKRPVVAMNKEEIGNFIKEIQKLLSICTSKLAREQIFMKCNGTNQLTIILPYSQNLQKSSNLYSQFHNKSVFCELFFETVHVNERVKCSQVFINNLESKNLFELILPYLPLNNTNQIKIKPDQIPQKLQDHNIKNIQNNQGQNKFNSQTNTNVTKTHAYNLMKEVSEEYPDIDEKEYEELMAYVHVNPNLKKEAGEAYMRQSNKIRMEEAGQEITEIVNNVSSSIFNMKEKKPVSQNNSNNVNHNNHHQDQHQDHGKGKNNPSGSFSSGSGSEKLKSKFEIKMNKDKLDANLFEVYFEAYYSIFKLFKATIRSFMEKYRNGFAGIIAAYFLTLIATLRRLKLYTDLEQRVDVFDLGEHVEKMDFSKFINMIRKELAKESRTLANLKNIIENAEMPYKTYEALLPFLDDDLEQIDLLATQNFCFFYMTVLMKMKKNRTYHEMLALEVMHVLISPEYDIVYSEEELPKFWNQEYFNIKKVLIEAVVPNWGDGV